MESRKNTLNRRQFLEGVAAASAFTIIPRHVLGGPQHVAPSDKVVVAQIGCGTQAMGQVFTGMIRREDLHIAAVCDPVEDSFDYIGWSRYGSRNSVRNLLGDDSWGENDPGIRAGRECAREVTERYYGQVRGTGYTGCNSYADFRELLEEETDIDGVVIITPDHTHTHIAIAAMQKGKAAISHKPISNVMHEVRRAVETARETDMVTHLLAWGHHPTFNQLDAWLKAGVIGPVREVHNWSARPFWPQGWLERPAERPPVPAGFDWDLWLGPEQHRPYHPDYTHTLYRGWYDYGAGCLGDMGNYSLWRAYRLLDLGQPLSAEATTTTEAFVVDRVSGRRHSEVAYPRASQIRMRYPARGSHPALDLFWYDGLMRPATPEELYQDGETLPNEGMLFVGDRGKILANFNGENCRIIPQSRANEVEGIYEVTDADAMNGDDQWINAIKNGGKSAGSFENVWPLAEAICLANAAVRTNSYLEWDPDAMRIKNNEEANKYLRREYRQGWAI